ncbi:Glycosyl transferase family 14 protein [Dioscorea alata]|uniref:Glycosyl transferase family 14 protein n=1 Tax=Dioscorea alata TaxID=55571 RepID=A0ACB7UVX0_DIOAL|nr:Glycosyl transferase family 14 protein [Dioscorea alata]
MKESKTSLGSIENNKDSIQKAKGKLLPLTIVKIVLVFLALGLGFSIVCMSMARYFWDKSLAMQSITRFQPCIGEETSLEKWIRPPLNLMHKMTDEQLFWRASLVPKVHNYPFKRVPKVAFMFLTRGPLPFLPLWDKFFKGQPHTLYSIYVHTLPSYKPDYPSSSVFHNRQIPSQVAEWGKMSMCDAERRLLANALLDFSNERFVLVSESCVPTVNFSTIYKYFVKSQHSFVGSFDEHSPHGRGRYNWNMAPEVEADQWRKGAQWFEVNRELAVTIVEDHKYYPKFEKFCKPSCYVDEHYFPTMLSIETPALIANRTVTFVDWSRGGAHPATFGKHDITEGFLRKITQGHTCLYNHQNTSLCFLFARKFAPNTLEPLLNLAPMIFGYG